VAHTDAAVYSRQRVSLRDELPELPGVRDRPIRVGVALAEWIERRAGVIVLGFLLLAAVSFPFASRLRVDQELRRLLPDDFPSVMRLDRLATEVGNQTDLYVAIRSPSRDANIAFGQALADGLKDHPDLRHVVFHRDRGFFETNALLFADIEDLIDLRRRLIERIRDEVRKKAMSGLSVISEKERKAAKEQAGTPERLDFDKEELEKKYEIEDFKEYYEADEGRLVVLRARPRAPPTDVKFSRALQLDVERIVGEIDPAKFDPELTVQLDGSYAQISKRVKRFESEIVGGSLASLFVLVASIALWFRSIRSILLVFVPLVGAVLLSLAFAALTYGFLNLVSAFIFAILLGLGIDFNIVLLTRYRDERMRGLSRPAAIAVTLATTGPASLFGGLSTGLGFGVLAFADFQGFAQFGVIALIGVFSAIAAALVVMPAMITLLDRVRPWKLKVRPHDPGRVKIDGTRRGSRIAALVVIALGLGWAAWSLLHVGDLEFEYDFDQLGPEKAVMESKELNYRDAVGRQRTVAPSVVLGDDLAQAEAVHRQLRALNDIDQAEAAAYDRDALSKPRPPDPAKDADVTPAAIATKAEPPPEESDEDEEEEPDDDDLLDEFEDTDLEDPKFIAIAEAAAKRPRIEPDVLDMLERYSPERLETMVDRMYDITSVFTFVPDEQEDKLAIIADMRQRIDAKRGSLSEQTKKDIDEWYAYLKVDKPLGIADLPEWVRDQFTDASGDIGRFVVIWTKGTKTDFRNVSRIYSAYGTLHTPTGDVETAAEFFVIPEVYEAIRTDGPRVVLLSFVVMLCTSIITFRSLSAGLSAALLVPLAITWLLGFMAAMGWKLNFFNVIALPLLVGLGEDAGLHMIARYREDGRGSMALVIRETGGAIMMTAWTTICGFASILWADHRGLQSLAWVSVVGVTFTFVAAIVFLPALAVLREWLSPAKPSSPPRE
jgi:predicted RND superfamily exporter protein